VRWFSDQFAAAERSVAARLGTNEFALLEAQAGRIPPGAEGLIVLPHWLGRRTPTPDANLKGSTLGWSPSHTSAHFYRAILEAFAYNVRQSFDGLRTQVRRLVATAGGAQSPLWRQIAADVLEMPLEYYAGSGGALGIAFLTAYALGLAKQFTDIKYAWLARPEVTTPQPEAVQLYRRLFPIYCAFDEVVAAPYAQLRKAVQEGEY
jgi:xylulokinase